jgi:hypothetical protein
VVGVLWIDDTIYVVIGLLPREQIMAKGGGLFGGPPKRPHYVVFVKTKNGDDLTVGNVREADYRDLESLFQRGQVRRSYVLIDRIYGHRTTVQVGDIASLTGNVVWVRSEREARQQMNPPSRRRRRRR